MLSKIVFVSLATYAAGQGNGTNGTACVQFLGGQTYPSNCTTLSISSCRGSSEVVGIYTTKSTSGNQTRCSGSLIASCRCGGNFTAEELGGAFSCDAYNILALRKMGPYFVNSSSAKITASASDGGETCQAVEDFLRIIIYIAVGACVVCVCIPLVVVVLCGTVCGVAICGMNSNKKTMVVSAENVYQPV